MKRILIFLLTLLQLSACLAGCRQVTAASVISAALAKTAALDSFEGTFIADLRLVMAGVSMEAPVTFEIKAQGLSQGKPRYSGSMKTVLPILSLSLESSYYMADGWVYYRSGSKKYKVGTEKDTDVSNGTEMARALNGSITKDMLKNITLTEEDGLRSVTLTLTGEQFKRCFTPLAEHLGSQYSENEMTDEIFEEISFRDVTLQLSVNGDGYIQKELIDLQMTVPFSSAEDCVVDITLTMEYRNPGQAVTVDVPADLEDYAEGGSGWNFDIDDIFGSDDGDGGWNFDIGDIFGNDDGVSEASEGEV